MSPTLAISTPKTEVPYPSPVSVRCLGANLARSYLHSMQDSTDFSFAEF